MPPPAPAKKKPPRAELAKALAAAAQWHFSTKNLTEANRRAAEKNYLFVKSRIRETGGDLTPEEKTLAKGIRAERSARPPRPRPMRSGDAADRAYVAREKNRQRGAAATGGMGRLERQRMENAVAQPKGPKQNEALLGVLRKEGFAEPETPEQANAQFRQLVKRYNRSSQSAYNRAAQHPLDLKKNTRLLGREEAEAMAKRVRSMPPPPTPGWAGKVERAAGAVGGALDWAIPERAERPAKWAGGKTLQAGWNITPAGLKPILRPVARDVKNLSAEFAMAAPAIAETVIKDILPGNEKYAGGTARLAKEMGIGLVKGAEAAVPWAIQPREAYKAAISGDWSKVRQISQEDLERAGTEWSERPVTSLLNTVGLVATPARVGSVSRLARSIGRANPNFSKLEVFQAAVKESYVPGFGEVTGKWEGGIPKRVLRGKIALPAKKGKPGEVVGELEDIQARPPSRTPLGRAVQATYDKWSRGEIAPAPGVIPGTRRFSELSRNAKMHARRERTSFEQEKTAVLREAAKIEKYIRQGGIGTAVKNTVLGRIKENRARMAEVYWVPQGPGRVDAIETLRALADDIRQIAEEGGQEIPTNLKLAIDKNLDTTGARLEKLDMGVDLSKGDWAAAANLMRRAGYSQPLIDNYLEMAAHRARVWAKREEGRDANDWLSSEEGRNLSGFKFGTPEGEALDQSLFQVLYPGNENIPEFKGNPYRENRLYMEDYRRRVESGEIDPETTPFDPPHKVAYKVTGESKKVTYQQQARKLIEENVDPRTGEMLPNGNPNEYAEIKDLLPREAKQYDIVDGEGEAQIGRTTLDQKKAELKAFYGALEPDAQDLFGRWYERVWDYVGYLYGEKAMREMGDAFFASQAAQSPSGGIANLFRIADKISRGEKLPDDAGFITTNIWKLMTGEHLGQDPAGLAAKLMDFMDSGLGFNMRTIMQEFAEGGPGVVDRWTWRSDGYYPPPNADEGGDMISRRIGEDMRYDTFLATNKGTAIAYEYSSKRLQLLTQELNDEVFDGRSDWTVDQVQALDWFATKKRWVEDGFTPKSAEGGSPLDMALDNTREFSFHGSPTEMKRIAKETGNGVRIISGIEPGMVPDVEGRLLVGEKPSFSRSKKGVTHAIVAGSGNALDRFRMRLGEVGHVTSMRYPGSMGGTKSQREHQFDIEAGREREAADAIRDVAKKNEPAPALYQMGDGTLRLGFGHGTRALDRAKRAANRLGVDEARIESRLTETSGTPNDVLTDVRRMEKALKNANRAYAKKVAEAKKKGRREPKRPPGDIEMEGALADLLERIGLKSGTHEDDAILEAAQAMVENSRGRHQTLYQRNARGIAGAVQFLDTDSGRQLLFLSEHANPSTFAHELFGHASYEMKREYPTEFAKVEKRYKKDLEDWTEAEHERFAREVERYLRSGKAPVDELQPLFTRMKAWMAVVYESINALGRRINPETKALMDRYFGKEPLDFTPPQRLRRSKRLPAADDLDAVNRLVERTGNLLMRGAETLRGDPAAIKEIAGNMKWIEQQILPYVEDAAVKERISDLFDEFDNVKSGSSIFNPDEQRLLAQRGRLFDQRHAQMKKMADALNAQPDQRLLDIANEVMEDLDNAETLDDINELIPKFKKVVAEVEDRTALDNESQRLLSRQVDDIERALDPDRKVNKAQRDEAIGVVREMQSHMKQMYLAIFGEGLSPEAYAKLERTLDARDNLIPTRLRERGLIDEGTGEGGYMPHHSVFDSIFYAMRGPVRLPAAGRSRKVLSEAVRNTKDTFARGPNKLIRYGKGVLRVDPRVMIRAYMNRLRFMETSALRGKLAEMSVDIPARSNGQPHIPQGWYVIKRKPELDDVPERLRYIMDHSEAEIDDTLAAGQDFDSLLTSDSETVAELQKYRDKWLTKDEIPDDWQDKNLGMLPPEVVEAMVGKVFDSAPGGKAAPFLGILSVGGRVATIFSHPMGYIHANVAANAMLLALTQPTRLGRAGAEFVPARVMRFFKTPVSLRARDPALYEDITVLTGDVRADAGLPEFYVKGQNPVEFTERAFTRGAARWASFLGDISDQPFRVASWTGHARKYGYNSPEDWRRLVDSDDPQEIEIREIVSQRAREDMLDFNKLNATEQQFARYLFIWPFVRASAAWPLWAVREYPGRMMVASQAAQAQERAIGDESIRAKYNAIAPAGERSMFDVSEVPVGGGSINMGPVNPVSPLAEKIVDLSSFLQNPSQMKPFVNLFNPAYTTFGEGAFSRQGVDWGEVASSVVPGVSFYRAATTPKKRGAQKYTDRDSWWDYIRRREGRFFPEDIDPEKIRESGKKEAEEADVRPTWEKEAEVDADWADKISAKIKEGGGHIDAWKREQIDVSIQAYHDLDRYEKEMADDLGKSEDDLTETERIEATHRVLKRYYPSVQGLKTPAQIAALPDKVRGKGYSKQRYREDLRDAIQAARSEYMSLGRDLGFDIP